jgi:hypothetical protein
VDDRGPLLRPTIVGDATIVDGAAVSAETDDLPARVVALIGVARDRRTASAPADRRLAQAWCTAVGNANPLFWDDAVARFVTGGPVLPPSTLPAWSRPRREWPGQGTDPDLPAPAVDLPVPGFDLPGWLDLADEVVTETALTFHEPVRPDDVISYASTLRSVSGETSTALGVGRFWVIELDYRNQRDELVGIEATTHFGSQQSLPASDPSSGQAAKAAALTASASSSVTAPPVTAPPAEDDTSPGGPRLLDRVVVGESLPEVRHEVTGRVLDMVTQAAWFERGLTDWTGPAGRPGWMTVGTQTPVVVGDVMTMSGRVRRAEVDATGCGWVDVDIRLTVGGRARSRGSARIAVPVAPDDNPWDRRGDRWRP